MEQLSFLVVLAFFFLFSSFCSLLLFILFLLQFGLEELGLRQLAFFGLWTFTGNKVQVVC